MRSLSVLLLFLFIPAIGLSDTIYVPDDYSSIQQSIQYSLQGDVIIVRPGTYVDNLNFNGKAITVQSEAGPQLTVIDGNRNRSVV